MQRHIFGNKKNIEKKGRTATWMNPEDGMPREGSQSPKTTDCMSPFTRKPRNRDSRDRECVCGRLWLGKPEGGKPRATGVEFLGGEEEVPDWLRRGLRKSANAPRHNGLLTSNCCAKAVFLFWKKEKKKKSIQKQTWESGSLV